jgi:hypothetical protein
MHVHESTQEKLQGISPNFRSVFNFGVFTQMLDCFGFKVELLGLIHPFF